MHDLMRKYRRYILLVLIIMVAVPFIFWVAPGRSSNAGPDSANDEIIFDVGGVPVYRSQLLRQLDQAVQQRTRGEQRPTYRELDEDGTVQTIIEGLLQQAILTYYEEKKGYTFERPFLEEQLRESFKNQEGTFDAAQYNDWLKSDPKRNWNALFEEVRAQTARDISVALISAPAARILDKEVEKKQIDDHTKIQVRYAKIEPAVEPAAEEVQKHYDENKESYRDPEKLVADYVSLSLMPPVPAQATDLVQRAKNGEDFAKLADEVSDLPAESKNGGFMGWQTLADDMPEYRKPVFQLPVGGISDPISTLGGYYIYKVDEERTNADTGAREVLARQIYVRATLTPEERTERDVKAKEIGEKAMELGSLAAAAQDLGLELKRTPPFTVETDSIDGIPQFDARSFRTGVARLTDDDKYKPIMGQQNIYVAEVVERTQGEIPPLSDVQEEVRTDLIAKLKQTDDYKAKVQGYVDRAKAEAKTLDDLKTLFPELTIEIKESQEVSAARGVIETMQVSLVHDAVGRGEPGKIGGPITSFTGETYFVELMKRTDPTEEERNTQEWKDELKSKRDMELQRNESVLLRDYLAYMLEKGQETIEITSNPAVLDATLGRGQKNEEPTDAEQPPATETAS